MDRHGRAPKGEIGPEPLIPKHGGFRRLKTFQISELIYDVTALFCEKYIDPRSRTRDQMVQAARSGRQNIAEGSVDSATSKKTELKLTGVARGSLEELRLDYEDYLRQRGLPQWPPDHPALVRFKARRCANLLEFRQWVAEEVRNTDEHGRNTDQHGKTTDQHGKTTDQHGRTRTDTDQHAPTNLDLPAPGSVRESPCPSVPVRVPPLPSVFAANGALSLLNLCLHLLDHQLQAQARAFENEGGFTERLHRVRSERRRTR